MDPFFAWALDPERQLVRQSANEVYRCRRGAETLFVRLTFPEHRARAEIEAEVAWMRSLGVAGVRVVEPVASRAGAWVETVEHDGRQAYAIVTRAAPGRVGRKPQDLTVAVVGAWGRLLADLHAHARGYAPPAEGRRPSWDADRVLLTALLDRSAETTWAQEALRALVAWMHGLPRTRAQFGLTHADLHVGNLAIADDGGATVVTAFDFDDACEQFFVHDLAVGVTSLRKAAWEYPGQVDADALVPAFLDAYARAGALDESAHERLERFVAYRIALSACWAGRSHATGQLDAEMDAWFRRSLPWWQANLRLA